MLKKINYKDTCHNGRPWRPTLHLTCGNDSDCGWYNLHIGFDTEELGDVAVIIHNTGGFDEGYMFVEQKKDGIITYYTYRFEYSLWQKNMRLYMIVLAERLLPYEQEKKIPKEYYRSSAEIAIDFINDIIENGRECETKESEFDDGFSAGFNGKFKCAYWGGDVIWGKEEKK